MRPRTHGLRLMHLAARCVELVKLSALAALPNQFAGCGIKAVTLPRWSAIMSSADSPPVRDLFSHSFGRVGKDRRVPNKICNLGI